MLDKLEITPYTCFRLNSKTKRETSNCNCEHIYIRVLSKICQGEKSKFRRMEV
nr:MAG TPA: hypothetical protein [Caudoviricetes sp.]